MLHLTPVHRFSHFFKVSRAVAKFSVGAPEKKNYFFYFHSCKEKNLLKVQLQGQIFIDFGNGFQWPHVLEHWEGKKTVSGYGIQNQPL